MPIAPVKAEYNKTHAFPWKATHRKLPRIAPTVCCYAENSCDTFLRGNVSRVNTTRHLTFIFRQYARRCGPRLDFHHLTLQHIGESQQKLVVDLDERGPLLWSGGPAPLHQFIN